ncbi:cupin domain-containing protein [Niabella ginsengisoli]|uniref:Cupin domain-containing protein n=1 Tax=Niabella ginsengisoli TaxID=522298 RepID=A0ABS9SL62_9BACT|nr:hypothetical protein [Niabella ginsengisoli]MCH5598894.1 hypothetical protein [Niabella ginsengisoli]
MKNLLTSLFIATLMIALLGCQGENKGAEANSSDSLQGITSEVLKTLKVSDIVILDGNKPLECRGLRLRLLTAAPGAKIAVHSHENRPAILSVVSGKGMDVTSYHMDKGAKETVTIPYGQSYAEFNNIVHYADNLSKTDTLRLITFDFLDDGSDCDGKKYQQNLPALEQLKKDNDSFYANNSAHVEGAEYSSPIFYVPLADIKYPAGSATFKDRVLRTRKVTLEAGKSLPQQNYLNRPTYVFVLEGLWKLKKVHLKRKL